MKRTIPILQRCICCPKCSKRTMRRAILQKLGKEYFCDHCHQYMGVTELVNYWNYDLGDFYNDYLKVPLSFRHEILKAIDEKIVATSWFNGDTVSMIDEPQFKSIKERNEAYDMVDRMYFEIPEWGMENNEIDYGYPIRG